MENYMRKIEWKLDVDPCTFIPVAICFLDEKSTGVRYSYEHVLDESVHFGKDEIVRCLKMNLDYDLTQRTDMTDEERIFALGDGFKTNAT